MVRTINYTRVGDCLWMLESLRASRRMVLLTDRNVYTHYRSLFDGQQTIVMEAGESAKTFQTYGQICRQLFELGADRTTLLVGVGGGVVTDMAGFVGATYMRGIAFGFVATTLMAQVDASLGGKNGVDMDGYKNIVGTFAEPEFVLCDPLFFSTLPERERAAGYAEVIKYALLDGLSLLDDRDVVARCVQIKLAIVDEDFREGGRRKLLNLGHTFAHGIEKCTTRYNHGEAVAIGLCIMARISNALGHLSKGEVQTIHSVVEHHGLPTMHEGVDAEELLSAAKLDKKRAADGLDMVLLRAIGDPIVSRLSFDALTDAYHAQG